MLSIVTLNLLNDLIFWKERSPLIIQELRDLSPDLIAFQEVALPINNAAWIAEQLGSYKVYLCPKTNQLRDREGLAILSRLPVEFHDTLALGAQNRVAQRVIIYHDGYRWMFINTHLFWSPVDDPIRIRQVEKLLGWIPIHIHAILCGDFNSLPHYRATRVLKRRMASAFELIHGREPDYTIPTRLRRGPGLRNSLRRTFFQMLGKVSNSPCPTWCGTVDYLFVSQPVRVLNCQLAFDHPSPDDETMYPSDHRGIMAKLAAA